MLLAWPARLTSPLSLGRLHFCQHGGGSAAQNSRADRSPGVVSPQRLRLRAGLSCWHCAKATCPAAARPCDDALRRERYSADAVRQRRDRLGQAERRDMKVETWNTSPTRTF